MLYHPLQIFIFEISLKVCIENKNDRVSLKMLLLDCISF